MAGSIVLMPNWIGDAVLALSVIERRVKSTGERMAMLVPEAFEGLLKLLTDLPVVPYSRATKRQFYAGRRKVRDCRFDSIYLLPYSFSSAWFAFRSGIRRRRGIDKDGRGILLTERLPSSTRNYRAHITREYAAVLETEPEDPRLWPGRRIDANEHFRGAVVVCPGATYGPAKRWPGFGKLLEALEGQRVVLVGAAGDSDSLTCGRTLESGGGEDLCGTTTLAEAARIIAAAKVVISNDSGLMHIAGYVGTPAVGIFGSTSPAWTRPLGKHVKILYTAEPCSPCFKRTCRYGHYNCLARIGVEELMRAATGLHIDGVPDLKKRT